MAGVAFGSPDTHPDIVFLHATGFNARTYRSLLAPLGERYHVVAIDARGHGRTELPPKMWGYASWRRHRDDLIALMERHFTRAVTLAGHSMGGTVSLLTAGRRPDLVSGLALIDPVILPPSMYAAVELPFGPLMLRHFYPIASKAAKRRNQFTDRESAATAFEGRGIFKAFTREMIEDYVGDGLVEDGKGGFKLSCSPAYEAATFSAHRHDPWGALRTVQCPITLLRAENHSTISEAAMHKIAAMKLGARVATVEGVGHMIPMERPDRVRAAIEAVALMAGQSWRDQVE